MWCYWPLLLPSRPVTLRLWMWITIRNLSQEWYPNSITVHCMMQHKVWVLHEKLLLELLRIGFLIFYLSKFSHFIFQIGHHNGLPDKVVDDYEHNEDFLKAVHHVLLEVCLRYLFLSLNDVSVCQNWGGVNFSYFESFIVLSIFSFKVDIVSGDLECPESGRKFPITRGIPNMLVNENEVNETNGSNNGS